MADHGDRETRPITADLSARIGKHTTGKGRLYVKRLEDVDRGVLEELIARAWATNHVKDAGT